MSKFSVLIRIGVIIFVTEGLIMLGLSLVDPISSPLVESLNDASLLTVLSAPPMYFLLVKPYAEERSRLLTEVESLMSGSGDRPEE